MSDRNRPNTTRIVGYTDRLAVAPGERVGFKVSCRDVATYSADIVRLVCADPDPTGPGLRYETIARDVGGALRGTQRRAPCGSCVVIPPAGGPDRLETFSVGMMVWPTRTGGSWQTLIGQWHASQERGYLLGLDGNGVPVLRVGDGRGNATDASTGVPLANREWAFIWASVDIGARTITLGHALLHPHGSSVERTSGNGVVPAELGAIAVGDLPIMMAAHCGSRTDAAEGRTGHFNGKIDSPVIARDAVDAETMRNLVAMRDPGGTDTDLIAAWDFSRGIEGTAVHDVSGNRRDGETVNLPARGVTGANWDGSVLDFRLAPTQYGAIHFHDDDIYDCGWPDDFEFRVPADARSGFYAARLTAPGVESWISFFVRAPRARADAPVAFVASTATFLAYANTHHRMDSGLNEHLYGSLLTFGEAEVFLGEYREIGGSLYDTHSDGSGVMYSSHLRPILNMRPGLYTFNYINDSYVLAWLEDIGQPYDVITDEDIDAEGAALLDRYRVVITGSHPEYFSLRMWQAFDSYQRRGGRHMYLGGNGFYWRIAFHPLLPGVIENRRGFEGVRTWEGEPGETTLSFTGEPGGLWRTQGRAPQALVGVGFSACLFDRSTYYRRTVESRDPRVAFMFEEIGFDERIGDFGQRGGGAAGLEIDRHDRLLGTPPHALVVATSENVGAGGILSVEEFTMTPPMVDGEQHGFVRADIVFFESPGGGAVWSVGSIAWPTSLLHRSGDNNVARMTTNVLRRFLDPTPFSV
jgi:N,N-dimethylformamidase